jgi:hypothetical protein
MRIFLLLLCFQYAFSQDFSALNKIEDTLNVLSYSVVNDPLEENRFASCNQLIKKLVSGLKFQNSFNYPFDRIQSVSIQYPSDSSFRIFTWQLYVKENEYRYFGAIQLNTPELKLFPLIDRSFEIEDSLQTRDLITDQWYGVVYYKTLSRNHPQFGNYYLLFGFDAFSFYKKRKVVDVLWFDQGKPRWGLPVFIKNEEKLKRLMIEYSSEVSVGFNYDEQLQLIIHDHLIEQEGKYGEGINRFPDGSYEGWREEKGEWWYVEKVFSQTNEEVPIPSPKPATGRKVDILGRIID